MNNKEKKEYLRLNTLSRSTIYQNTIEEREKYILKLPKALFKYRKFDKYTLDMIKNEYVYLSPAINLDDPFDCLSANNDFENVYRNKNNHFVLNTQVLEYISNIVLRYPHYNKIKKSDILSLIKKSIVNGQMCTDLLKGELEKNSFLTFEQVEMLINILNNINPIISQTFDSDVFKELFSFYTHLSKKIGVCSLTTKRDNKPMWSLYANTYKGYCIEYELPSPEKITCNILPVVYTKRFNNGIINAITQFVIGGIVYKISNGKVANGVESFYELICTKDSDWSYQDEWRILGDANSKISSLKIKRIYLGFMVSKRNEQLILKCSSTKNFEVYKMNKPKDGTKITYTKLTYK